MSATRATGSWQKRNSTPRRLLVRSGPDNNSLLRDTPLDSAAASKTTCILSFFLGWYQPKWGRYHQSFSGLRFSCGTISAWSGSKIFCMKVKYCSFITGFLSRVRRVDFRRFIAFARLLGRSLTSCRKSSGVSQLLFSFVFILYDLIWSRPQSPQRKTSEGYTHPKLLDRLRKVEVIVDQMMRGALY